MASRGVGLDGGIGMMRNAGAGVVCRGVSVVVCHRRQGESRADGGKGYHYSKRCCYSGIGMAQVGKMYLLCPL